MIKFSAPGKVHLLGEHAVVYGKPALLATVGLRVTVTVIPANAPLRRSRYPWGAGIQLSDHSEDNSQRLLTTSSSELDPDIRRDDILKNIIEPIVKKYLKIKTIPPYKLEISSELPIGSGLGSSAAISAAYIAALLTFLKVKWDKQLVNELTYQAEKVFHGSPSGGDNSTVVYGGLVWFRKETPDFKIIQPLPFSVPHKLAKNFVLINTGKPKETTKEMVELVSSEFRVQSSEFKKIFESQEQLVREFVIAIKEDDEKKLIQIIRKGEKNLENLGVVSSFAKSIIRKIERAGGAAKICGGGGKTKEVGVLLTYHSKPATIKSVAKEENLPCLSTTLGVEGLRQETS